VAVADEPAKKAPAKKAAAKKTAAKKAAGKKTPVKTAPAKKTAAKKTAPKKTAAKKAPAKKTAAKKTAAKVPTAMTAPAPAPGPADPPAAVRPEVAAAPRPAATPVATGIVEDARALGRLVGAYRRGSYREVPPRKLALVAAGLAYVASPLDAVPDAVPLGFLDDVVVLALVLRAAKTEVDAFRRWEQRQR
jgi:uncharacterized membrane protein YkvA (DUF1232 family)